MIQMSTYIYGDSMFETMEIEQKLLASPYKDYPYLIIKDFFSKPACRELVKLVQEDEETKRKAKVKTEVFAGVVQPDLVEAYRKTNIYKLDRFYQEYYDQQFLHYQPMIESYFNIALTLSTQVQVLEYKKGFFYIKHADDSSEMIDPEGKTVGFKVVAPERKLSTVLFATSHVSQVIDPETTFEGGELLFNYLYDKEGKVVKLQPEAGDMIIFPSNPYFSHEVLPVKEGYRLTLVQWHDILS